jgi:hypothetical protein
MDVIDIWRPARCCGINRRVHGYEQQIFPRIPLHYISDSSDNNGFIRKLEVSHS